MKPILFSTDMVRAILDGRKTQTRRAIKPQTKGTPRYNSLRYHWYDHYFRPGFQFVNDVTPMPRQPFRAGEILWVRETWTKEGDFIAYKADVFDGKVGAHNSDFSLAPTFKAHMLKWRPSIHMPREAARLFLRVTGVRCEKLQEITNDGAKAEGCDDIPNRAKGNLANFLFLWDELNAKSGYGWDTNPWVFVYTFEKISKKEARRSNGN
ncbi:hypothetical protein FACS189425_03620 [Clostridia bacterium]|nr:hypothetical protein FACS189425_03620 [Clostridia bacterium]